MTRNPPGAIGAAEGGRVLSSKARLEFGESEQATSYVTATQIIFGGWSELRDVSSEVHQ